MVLSTHHFLLACFYSIYFTFHAVCTIFTCAASAKLKIFYPIHPIIIIIIIIIPTFNKSEMTPSSANGQMVVVKGGSYCSVTVNGWVTQSPELSNEFQCSWLFKIHLRHLYYNWNFVCFLYHFTINLLWWCANIHIMNLSFHGLYRRVILKFVIPTFQNNNIFVYLSIRVVIFMG